ncbi:NAD(P)/FAD-dependent oxidoreductase [Lawsonibacter faecis]|uniref:FAD-dependent oxidoreductase n=1 Tax=Lawsonibacter faecis TaxID=2763052 RepID=A0A8J6MFS0_9FIRM|nr:NAD(P)/FAD-dependent oxidoreductase [Lawsonibacter faecis]MBC5735648.1 FAD-dependent oxidoreductase [Lawsonibacter faecis]
MDRAVIVGFGCAGYHAASALRRNGWDGEIHIFSESGAAPANPMLTTYYVSGKLPYDGMFPFGPPEEIAARLDLTLHMDVAVERVDYEAQKVVCSDGSQWTWSKLLLATGARALVPPLPGADDGEVYCMRTVQDAERLQARLERGGVRAAVVVGASMVGIKVVELLRRRDVAVTMADMAPGIFPVAALPEIGRVIEDRVRAKGVELRFGSGISAITRGGETLTASFSDGAEIPCDLVVLCIGTRANTALAGETVKVGRGVVVDEHMRTNVEGVYAAGDCCEGLNRQSGQTQIIGLWANAASQGEVAGTNMAGGSAVHTGEILHNITHFFDMDFIAFGDNRAQGSVLEYRSADGRTVLRAVLRDGKIACLNLLDNYKVSGVMKDYVIRRLDGSGTALYPRGAARLRAEGIPGEIISALEKTSAAINGQE